MITAIIQARLSSTRLPRKVLNEFSGNTLLGHIIERISKSKSISAVIIATTTNPQDDLLVQWLRGRGVNYFRGDENDVLNRYYEAALYCNAQHIARITSDDPFKDPEIIDDVAEMYFSQSLDFAYNNKPLSFAEGLDTEIFSLAALKKAQSSTSDPFEREHVTQHFYRNPEKFVQKNLKSEIDFSHLRWTVDTEQDLLMTKTIYQELYSAEKIFLTKDILQLLERRPEISRINQSVKRSDMYKNKKNETNY